MRVIKVFGPGCLKCEALYENVVKALAGREYSLLATFLP